MKRVDFHVHCNSGDPALVAELASSCRKADTMAVMIGGLRYGEADFLPNDEVMKICRQYPDCFIPAAKLDLWQTANADEVFRFKEQGFKALKAIYPWYEYDHDLYMPVYEAAEKADLPILFHTGNYRPCPDDRINRRPMLRNMHPITLDRICRTFQDLHVVMAHLGTSFYRDEAAGYLTMHKNLYTDFGGCGQWRGIHPHDLLELFNDPMNLLNSQCQRLKKLVLGSDAYVTHPHLIAEAQRNYEFLLQRVGATPEILEAVMGRTVAAWLNVDVD